MKKLKILIVGTEMAPFAKTGGLADVTSSLSAALARKGHDVRAVIPCYREIAGEKGYVTDFPIDIEGTTETCVIRSMTHSAENGTKKAEVPLYLVDSHRYFDREGYYGHMDDGARFAFFCRAVLEMLPAIDFFPDVLHLNDWQTGPITLMLKTTYQAREGYENIKTLFTIHNLQYQGNFSPDMMRLFGFAPELFTSEALEFYGQFSFMKTGILYADIVNTVSRTYAKEILTPEYGELLDGVLNTRKKDLYGIVNGVGQEMFSPEADALLPMTYDLERLEVKGKLKEMVQEKAGFKKTNVPLAAVVHRLVEQKGFDLAFGALDEALGAGKLQLVVLGLGDPYYIRKFQALEEKYPDAVRGFYRFDEPLAHLFYAGADLFLMPSKFEPCGLGQMIAQGYGTLPIVRSVGGLADTVISYDKEGGNGFSFAPYTAEAFRETLFGALEAYKKKKLWQKLRENAMKADNSWETRASLYVDLYKKAMKK